MPNNIHIANTLPRSVWVMPSKNTSWLVADLVTDAALFAVGVGEIRAVLSGTVVLPEAIATLGDLFKFLKGAGTLLGGTIATGSRSGEAVLELVRHFKENAIEIPPNDFRNVLQSSLMDYLSASGLASLVGLSTITLTILSDDGLRTVQFDTSNDSSWIAIPTALVCAKFGTLWQQSPDAGSFPWIVSELSGAIKIQNQFFLTAANNGGLGVGASVPIRTTSTTVGPNEIFNMRILDNELGQFALQTAGGQYLTALNNGGVGGPNGDASPVHTDARRIGPWERFIFEQQPGGGYAIRTSTGFYLTAVDGGGVSNGATFPVATTVTQIGPWETFTFTGSTPPA
jgi:hypothetical protein